MKKKFLCTLGPSSFNEKTIRRLTALGVELFRINLSHTRLNEIEERINFIRQYTDVPICLDSEGAQVRTGTMLSGKTYFQENVVLEVVPGKVINEGQISLYPDFIVEELRQGDILSIDFDSALLQIISDKNPPLARVISSGQVGNNKAVSFLRDVDLPAFTEKDIEAIKIGKKLGIKHFALSFASCKKDVEEFRKMVGDDAFIISKIESKVGCRNLQDIIDSSDAILIDRGDLSRQIPIEVIPFFQRKIIEDANNSNVPVYVATNLLESMTENSNPTRAEVNDVINALIMGADGLVLAGETAIGKWPIKTASMIVKLINQYEKSKEKDISKHLMHVTSLLADPHGVELIDRWEKNPDWDRIKTLKKITVSDTVMMDVEQIGIGTYSPLTGFMNREEILSVLDSYSMPSGDVWTLPIIFQENREAIKHINIGDEVALFRKNDENIYATIKISDIYVFPFEKICEKWYGTLDEKHPGVCNLKAGGDVFIGGEITLLNRCPSENKIYEYTPSELRHIFDSKGWSRVVGFHTRNVCHRAHESIQKKALVLTHADGVLISPVVGKKKTGDFKGEIVLRTYQKLMDVKVYDGQNFFISAFSTYSRYSGAREAIFTAICRQNFGCSHFIMGRDHTGVGNFYAANSSQELFSLLKDKLIIQPVLFDEVKYCPECDDHNSGCNHSNEKKMSVSGTEIRETLLAQKRPEIWALREEVSQILLDCIANNKEVFEG